MDQRIVYSLSEACGWLETAVSQSFPSAFWLKAEISKLNYYHYSGHAYPDLVEKQNGQVVAQMRAIIWRNDLIRINKNFQDVIKQPLSDGISITFLARMTYSTKFGLSLIIQDIDPYVILGDLERERLECISRLQQEGLWNMNKQKPFPLLPKRLAIISVESSKGYCDFMQTIQNNKFGVEFFTHLFPSILQGDEASRQIRLALDKIEKVKGDFDCVLIIRGGGGDVGLTCYNDYELCKRIASYPLCVLTGVGHSTNQTVAEMVSYQSFITPTALGEHIINIFANKFTELNALVERIINQSKLMLVKQKNALTNINEKTKTLSQKLLSLEKTNIQNISNRLPLAANNILEKQKLILLQDEKLVNILQPKNILKKGYSITKVNGKLVTSLEDVKPNDKIQTTTYNGVINSIVE